MFSTAAHRVRPHQDLLYVMVSNTVMFALLMARLTSW